MSTIIHREIILGVIKEENKHVFIINFIDLISEFFCFLEGHVIRTPSSGTHDLGFGQKLLVRKKLMTCP